MANTRTDNMNPTIQRRKVLISEQPDGRWQDQDLTYGTVHYRDTAIKAQKLVKEQDKRATKKGVDIAVSQITYRYRTRVGKMVVEAIAC